MIQQQNCQGLRCEMLINLVVLNTFSEKLKPKYCINYR